MEQLTKGALSLFNWLRVQTAGTIVQKSTVLSVTGWKESSLSTYLSKNKLAPFLVMVGSDELRILMNGSEITQEYYYEVFRQTRPGSRCR